MNVFELVAILTLNKSAYDKGLSDAQSKAEGSGSTIGSALGKAGKAVVAGFAAAGAGAVAFAKASMDTGMNFDSAMSQVAATMGTTVDNIQDMSAAAQEMGATTAFTATESAEALNYLALAGYSSEQAIATLPSVLNLASAGNMNLAQASDMVTDAMSALGLEADAEGKNVTDFGDKLAKTASKTNTSVSQLGDAILTVGATGKSMAGSMVELANGEKVAVSGTSNLNTALGILANVGIKGSEGGTHLRNVILSLQSPTDNAADALKELGVSVYDANGQMRPLNDILSDLNAGMDGCTDATKDMYKSLIFNKTDLASVNALLDEAGEEWDELSAEIEKSGGAMQDMADTQLDNLQGDLTLLSSGVDGLKMSFYNTFSDKLRTSVQGITTVIQALTDGMSEDGLSGAIKAVGKVIASNLVSGVKEIMSGGASLMEGLATSISENAPAVSEQFGIIVRGLARTIINHAPALISSGGDLIISLAKGILSTAGTLGQAFISVVTNVLPLLLQQATILISVGADFIKNIGQGLVDGIPELLGQFLPLLLTIAETARANAGVLIDAGLDFIVNMVQGIMNGLPLLIEYVPQIIENIAGIINDNAPKVLMAGWNILVTIGQGLINAIPTLVANIPQIISAIVSVIQAFNWLNLGKNIIEFFKNGIVAMKGVVTTAGGDIKNSIITVIKELPSKLMQLGKDGISGIKNAFSGGLGTVKSAATTILTNIVSAIQAMPGKLIALVKSAVTGMKTAFTSVSWSQLGKNLINGVVSGIKAAAGNLAKAAINAVKGALGAAKKETNTRSPSRKWRDELGKNLGEGTAIGLEQNKRPITAAKNMVKNMFDEAQSKYDELGGKSYTGNYNSSTSYNSQGNLAELMKNVFDLLDYYMPDLSKRQVVLDTGATVGALAKPMDKALAEILDRRGRGR